MAVNLVNRVQKILLSPKSEWDVIDKEPADVTGTLTTYVGPLVVLSALAAAAGLIIFGISIGFGLTIRPPITSVLIQAVLAVVLGIVSVYILAFVIDALAPSFGAQKNFNQAFKVAAFYPTAYWLGSLLAIVPAIGWIGSLVGGLYSLYLLFVGLPKLMKPPADKGIVYTIVVIVVLIVIYLIIGFIVAKVAMSFAPTPTVTGNFGGIQVAP